MAPGAARSADVERFVRDGFIVVAGAVPQKVVSACQRDIDDELRKVGVDPDDRSTWTRPVVRIRTPLTEAFARAIVQPALDSACDALLGPGRWVRKAHVGGTVPVRFPHADDPGDAGWHIDGSYDVDGAWWVNVRSRWRGLLALYLFSDVELEDAPTEVKVGSHLDIPPVLVVFGDTGVPFEAVSASLLATTLDRPSAFVTGSAGDVYLCHPFLLHRATWPHRGCRPRAIAQPEVPHNDPFVLDGVDPCPVEEAILRGLGGPI